MPELPDVEIVKRRISPAIINRTIKKIIIKDPRLIKKISIETFKKLAKKRKIKKIKRIGKYLIFYLTGNVFLVFHLGMAGDLILTEDKFTRISFKLTGNKILNFSDRRVFGKIYLFREEPDLKLGPDLLRPEFNLKYLKNNLKRHKRKIKVLLLDQHFLAGLGNIYAIESLFCAKISPFRRSSSLKETEISNLFRCVKKVIKLGIKSKFRLRVYDREGEKCYRCGGRISRENLGNRGTYFCPGCQK